MGATEQPSHLAVDQLEVRRERALAERYLLSQREAMDKGLGDGPRPLEYDKNGFPLPQRRAGFVKRVARLLNPSLGP